ncbi:unnamed protein product [Brassica oleracea]
MEFVEWCRGQLLQSLLEKIFSVRIHISRILCKCKRRRVDVYEKSSILQ